MKNLLVVDDEHLICYALSEMFKDADTDVMTAPDGGAALKAIQENHFDLCFLDIYLPEINGLDIMRELRHLSPGTRIVVMTGSEITDQMMKSIQENAHLLISKPFDFIRIKKFVDRILSTGRTLYGEERAALRDHGWFVKWIADDNRKHERKPVSKCITCFPVASPGEMIRDVLSANVVDISEAGMCIRTDCLLKPGRLLRLSDAPEERTGVVRWSRSSASTESYHAGIQFVTDEYTWTGLQH